MCLDLYTLGLLSGSRMQVQDSDSVVYAVINRGRCHWISVFLWACFSVQAFAAIGMHSVIMHAGDKRHLHQTFKG